MDRVLKRLFITKTHVRMYSVCHCLLLVSEPSSPHVMQRRRRCRHAWHSFHGLHVSCVTALAMAAEKELEDADAERGSQECNGGGAFVNKHGLPSRMAHGHIHTAGRSSWYARRDRPFPVAVGYLVLVVRSAHTHSIRVDVLCNFPKFADTVVARSSAELSVSSSPISSLCRAVSIILTAQVR